MDPVTLFFHNRKLKKRHKELRAVVRDTLAADDDILTEQEKERYREIRQEILAADPEDERAIELLEKKLKTFHDRSSAFYTVRGWLDVLAVALAVAFGIRALYLQPFQIPTSSMQPTLFGIHFIDRKEGMEKAGFLTKLFYPLGASAAKLEVTESGEYREGSIPVKRSLASLLKSVFTPSEFYLSGSRVAVGSKLYTVPGDNPADHIYRYLDKDPQKQFFEKGDVVFDGIVSSGDHLFVDRFSMHFYPLRRGEIFIFHTGGLRFRGHPLPGYYYVKRLVGMPGDTLKIMENILYIRPEGDTEFHRADELSEKLKRIYSFRGGYQGHKALGLLAEGTEFKVPADSYFALGDNTNNSLDSRYWGPVPHANIIGRALNVFWPVSRRWGIIDILPPLDTETVYPEKSTQPTAMRMQ